MDDFIAEISKQGILGTMLALSLVSLFTAVKLLLNEKDKRIEDANKVRDTIAAPLANIKDSIDLLQQKVTIAKRGDKDVDN